MPRNLFDVLLLVAGVLGLGALAAWTALYSPARPAQIEADLQAGAERALFEKGFAWAEVAVSGQAATLRGTAPNDGQRNQARDAIYASARTPLPGWVRRYAGGDLPAGGMIWGGITAINDLSVVTDVVSPYVLRADTVSGGLILSGYVVSEDDRDALFTAAETAFPGLVTAELELAPGAPDADWLGMAEFAMAVLGKMEMGAVEVSDTDVVVTGLVADEESLTALEASLSDAPDGFTVTSQLAIGTAPAETVRTPATSAEDAPVPAAETVTQAPSQPVSEPEPEVETRAPVSRPEPEPEPETEQESVPVVTETPAEQPAAEEAAPGTTGEAAPDTDAATPADTEPASIDPYELEARLREQQANASQTAADPDTNEQDADTDTETPADTEPDTGPVETPEEN